MEQMQLLRETELAELLKVKPRTIKLWRKLERGPRVTRLNSGCVRYRVRDVEKWLEACSQKEGTAA